jgi:hypothetical protein
MKLVDITADDAMEIMDQHQPQWWIEWASQRDLAEAASSLMSADQREKMLKNRARDKVMLVLQAAYQITKDQREEEVPKPAPVTMVTYWAGPVPTKCDLCNVALGPIRRRFFDMATSKGMWGCLCDTCAAFEIGNRQYGPGVGQEYQYDNLSAKWLKVRG